MKASKKELLNEIKEKKALDASIEDRLQAAIKEFKKDFKA
jgi:F-type H+-transporting ATPase subunit alpha